MEFSILNYKISINKLNKKYRSIVLVDSENIRFALKDTIDKEVDNEYFLNFLKKNLSDINSEERVFYFASLPKNCNEKIKEDQNKRLEAFRKAGYRMIKAGNVQWRVKENKLGNEKGVDVRIAIDLLKYQKEGYKKIYLISSDSDLIPAIREVKSRGCSICYMSIKDKINLGVRNNCSEFKELLV